MYSIAILSNGLPSRLPDKRSDFLRLRDIRAMASLDLKHELNARILNDLANLLERNALVLQRKNIRGRDVLPCLVSDSGIGHARLGGSVNRLGVPLGECSLRTLGTRMSSCLPSTWHLWGRGHYRTWCRHQ
jgi:hypothetical protein